MLLQAHFDFFEEVHRKNIENKKKREELNKWLEWACNNPDVKNVWIKSKVDNQFKNIKGEEECPMQLQLME